MKNKYEVIDAGYEWHIPGKCCNEKQERYKVVVPEHTKGFLISNNEMWKRIEESGGNYIGCTGDGSPIKIIMADDGNYYGLGYGFKLKKI